MEFATRNICIKAANLMNEYDNGVFPDDRFYDELRAALVAENWIEKREPDEATPTPSANDAATPHQEGVAPDART